MRLSSLIATGFFTALSSFAQAQSFNTAMAALDITDPNGKRDLSGFVWYPTQATGPLTSDFDSEVWESTQIVRDAEPSAGPFPLVVLSHGMYGNAYNQAWLASALARQGYVVTAISHPGTSTWSRDPDATRQLWERPRDVTRVIDYVTTTSEFAPVVDPQKVYMAGHSLGGFTAIALAGARFDTARWNSFCDKTPDELACNILTDWKIAQTEEDRIQMEADLSDPRIRAFAIFDLGGTQSFSDKSLAQLDRPLLVFGAPIMNSGLTLDIESRALRDAVSPGVAKYIEPPTLSHFDFLGLCKPGGFELLKREEPGDEVICEDGGAPRAKKHQMIVDEVTRFFSQN